MNQALEKPDQDDEEFNNYLMMFSVPGASPLEKQRPNLLQLSTQNEEVSDLEEIIEELDTVSHSYSNLTLPGTGISTNDQIQYLRNLDKELESMDPVERSIKEQELLEYLIRVIRKSDLLDLEILDLLSTKISLLVARNQSLMVSIAKNEIQRIQKVPLEDWPKTGDLILMRIFQELFNNSDHPVLQSLMIVYSKWLIDGPLKIEQDFVSGLFLASCMDSVLKRKFCPEILSFYTRLIRKLELSPLEQNSDKTGFCFGLKLADFVKQDFQFGSLGIHVLHTALTGIQHLTEQYQKAVCFPELFHRLLESLKALKSTHCSLPGALSSFLGDLISHLEDQIVARASSRSPMKQNQVIEKGLKQRQPVFEETMDFEETKKWKLESTQDRRKLKRKLNKEHRGAIKELRKDGLYIAQVRSEEKRKIDEQRARNEKSFYKELRSFDEDMRRGGQAGMNPHLKKDKRLSKY